MSDRGPDGKFIKGNKGGPGRPKVEEEVRELCRALSVEAVEVLAKIMRNDEVKPRERMMASNSILDRAYGKPGQQKVEADDDMPIPQVVVNVSTEEYKEVLVDHQNSVDEDDDED